MKSERKNGINWLYFLLLFMVFLLVFPVSEQDTHHKSRIFEEEGVSVPPEVSIDKLVKELEKQGFKVENRFPAYVEVKGEEFIGSPVDFAGELSRRIYRETGKRVKVILVCGNERFVGYYSP
ncbi:MAG: hypothetical protein B6D65_01920 [candidate division Zixibacteria bacterium 4484_93]|nr:MAG: hypothetical protein B6D65_01920 [candidate division Zixibacteria bacterium 4484_93]RKZ34489.1 MAG: hypothetical protein DRQ19_00960 [bacterium]